MTAAVTQRNHGNHFSVTSSQEKKQHRRIETGINKHLNHRNLKKYIVSSLGSVSTSTMNDPNIVKMTAFGRRLKA